MRYQQLRTAVLRPRPARHSQRQTLKASLCDTGINTASNAREVRDQAAEGGTRRIRSAQCSGYKPQVDGRIAASNSRLARGPSARWGWSIVTSPPVPRRPCGIGAERQGRSIPSAAIFRYRVDLDIPSRFAASALLP